MKKKTNKRQAEYNKQLKRIRQFIRRAEKRGYDFPSNVIPKKPKRITDASIRRLTKITPEYLYKHGRYGGEASGGEIIPAEQGRKLERKVSAKRAAEARRLNKQEIFYEKPKRVLEDRNFFSYQVIENFKVNANKFNINFSTKIISWINMLIDKYGEDAVSEMLEAGARDGKLINYQMAYDGRLLNQYIASMLDYLPDVGEIMKEDILEAVEESDVLIE